MSRRRSAIICAFVAASSVVMAERRCSRSRQSAVWESSTNEKEPARARVSGMVSASEGRGGGAEGRGGSSVIIGSEGGRMVGGPQGREGGGMAENEEIQEGGHRE